MVDLVQKGASAQISNAVRALTITMKWATQTDFDLAAAFMGKDGKIKLAYFGNIDKADGQGFKQDLNAYPFIKLSGDAGVGDSEDAGGNEEELKIGSLVDHETVWILGWDYGAISNKEGARFQGSGLSLHVVDDQNASHDVTLSLAEGDLAPKANISVIAMIETAADGSKKIVNSSHTGLLEGLTSLDQIMDFVKAA